ncbi:MAG: hypothetical protein E7247_02945 [Paenibacillaceae bacterium]|nr:hypothetical protein [Paenibacillaceae bacterium]
MTIRWDMRGKTPQQQAIVAAKDKNSTIMRKNSNYTTVSSVLIHPISIFMKLGWDSKGNFDGFQTLEEYMRCVEDQGSTWFSTNVLASGMSKKQLEKFKKAIGNKERIYIYFVIGKSGGGINEIEFRAEVIDMASAKGGIKTPSEIETPKLWINDICTIWIKLIRLRRYNAKKADDFKFVSNGRPLSGSLKSNCCFGYITND